MSIVSILIALLIFSLIIVFHELGHFLLAKRGGIAVTEFSLGMGPRIWSKQIGETRYSWKILPFGGSCMMVGEDEDSEDENAFGKKSVWTRILVVAAGPVFNFILAFILALFIIGSIGYDAPVLYDVLDGYPAQEAGMQAGDRIIRMNDKTIHIYREVSLYSQLHQGETVTVTYERDGEQYTTVLEPKQSESGSWLLGFQGSGIRTKGNLWQTIYYSAYEVKFWIAMTIESLGMLIGGEVGADDISGPVGIINTIGETYEASKQDGAFYVWLNMMSMSILLSANLGVVNLLPIPAMDGGRLVFLFLEVIRRGKKIDPDKEGMVHFVGLMLLMILMVFVMFNDFRNIL